MSNHPLFVLILLFLVLTAVVAVALLTQEIILGYSGFALFNSQQGLIKLTENCPETYFSRKFNYQTLEKTLKITSLCSIVQVVLPLISIFIMAVTLQGFSERQSQQREQTGIEQEHLSNLGKMIFFPKKVQQFALFTMISFTILCSLVISKKYFQFYQQSTNDKCPITITNSHIISLTILSLIILCFSVLTLIFFIAIMCRINQRVEMLSKQNQNQSLSYRHQVQRIIRDAPQSQRQLMKIKSATPGAPEKDEKKSHYQERQLKQNQSKGKEEEGKQGLVSGMQKVQSIIYKASPSLMIQSANN